MAKIDIITLTGLTGTDGSVIASGATIKFSSEFMTRNTQIIVRPQVWRNRTLFESGYDSIKAREIPEEMVLEVLEEDYYVLTPTLLYEMVKDELNASYGANVFDVHITP